MGETRCLVAWVLVHVLTWLRYACVHVCMYRRDRQHYLFRLHAAHHSTHAASRVRLFVCFVAVGQDSVEKNRCIASSSSPLLLPIRVCCHAAFFKTTRAKSNTYKQTRMHRCASASAVRCAAGVGISYAGFNLRTQVSWCPKYPLCFFGKASTLCRGYCNVWGVCAHTAIRTPHVRGCTC